MKKSNCRFISLLILCCVLLGILRFSLKVRAENKGVLYNNTQTAEMTASCGTNGLLEINILYSRKPYVTATARIETYIEKRSFLGIFWTRVDIEPENDIWVDQTNANSFSTSYVHYLTTNGTYRIKTKFIVSGTGGADETIEKTQQITY